MCFRGRCYAGRYDVWLGSNRGVLLDHAVHQSDDDAFWDWCVDDLAQYDVPCIVERVLSVTGTL